MTTPSINLLLAGATLVAATAAVIDYRKGVIPNWLTFSTLGLGTVAHVVVYSRSFPAPGLGLWVGQALAGVLLCGLVPFIMWKRDAMGGGDMKLLAALGGLLGPVVGMEAQLYAFLAALLLSPIKLAYEGKLLAVAGNALQVMVNPFLPKSRQRSLRPELLHELRFGPAVLVGVLAATALHWSRSA